MKPPKDPVVVTRQLTTPPVYPESRLVGILRAMITGEEALPDVRLPPVYLPTGPGPLSFSLDSLITTEMMAILSVDSFLAQERNRLFSLSSAIAEIQSEIHSIDTDLASLVSAYFSVDSLTCPTPGVFIAVGPTSGTWTCPAGVHSVNVFVWGAGGRGNVWFPPGGGSGGGGGGFAWRQGGVVTPGQPYDYLVTFSSMLDRTTITLDDGQVYAQQGGDGTTAGGGAGGFSFGGDITVNGGRGGDCELVFNSLYGAGGGQAGNSDGNGIDGQDAQPDSPGIGGGPLYTWGSGGQGGVPLGTTFGIPGTFPGGGGGGQGFDGGIVPETYTPGGQGLLIITWDAQVHFVDSALSKEGTESFAVDSFLAGQASITFSLGTLLAQRRTAQFTLNSLLALKRSTSFSINSQLASKQSTSHSISSVKSAKVSAAHTVATVPATKKTNTSAIDTDIAAYYNLSFHAADSKYVDFGNPFSVFSLTGAMSLSAWIFPLIITGNRFVLGRWSDFTNQGGYNIQVAASKIFFQIFNSGETVGTNLSSATISTNTIYHVVGTWDGSSAMKLYVNNGTPVTGTCTTTPGGLGNLLCGAGYTSAGISPGTIGYFFDGAIDALRIYNKALSASEVSEIFGGGYGLATAGSASANLLGWWRFDEGSGSIANDSSGNGRNGTLTNAPIYQIATIIG